MIGDVVGTLSVAGFNSVTYTLVDNPNGSFAIAGNTLTQAVAGLPDGNYTFSIQATPLGGFPSFTQTITLTHLAGSLVDANGSLLQDANGAFLIGLLGAALFAPNLAALYISQGIY